MIIENAFSFGFYAALGVFSAVGLLLACGFIVGLIVIAWK